MTMPLLSSSPRVKAGIACGLVLGLCVLAPRGGFPADVAARWLLGAAVLVGLGGVALQRWEGGPRSVPPERLRVVSRARLSPRCGLALVEVDGGCFLVAFGDGFAEIHTAAPLTRKEDAP